MLSLVFYSTDVLFVVSVVLFVLYWYQTRNFKYWEKRGVPFVKPHWFFGNIGHQIMQRKTCTEFAKNLYNRFKEKGHGGIFIFRKPAILLCSPDIIECVLTKDFAHFEDRSVATNPDEVLSDTLYSSSGEKWRAMRHKLIPTLSSAKVKGMFDQVLKCAECFCDEIEKCSQTSKNFNIEPLSFMFSTEVIASCAFGVQLMADTVGAKKFKDAVDLIFDAGPLRLTKMFLGIMWPRVFQVLRINFIPKQVTRFFMTLTKETIEYRVQNNVKRNDFLQLVLNLKKHEENGKEGNDFNTLGDEDTVLVKNCHIKGKLSDNERFFTEKIIASLTFNLLSAGVKPVTSTISFALLEISKSPEVQTTVREEVDSCIAKHGGLNYEAIKSMTYLDQIIQEVHRLYPFSKVLTRTVTSSYKMPGTDLILEKGTVVYIPISAIHMDPNYYPSPEEFMPERFSGNNFKPNVAFMPYGNGPRICIGIKFAVLLMKVCIAKVVSQYELKLDMQLPITWDGNICTPQPKDGVGISFERRETIIT